MTLNPERKRKQAKPSKQAIPRMVREEEQMLKKVKNALATARPGKFSDYDQAMIQLRDAMSEEKLLDDRARMLEQMDRLAAISRTRAQFTPGMVDQESPYFAHLGLETDEGHRSDVLLGKQTFIKGGVRIVDWRNAPISKVFYRYREGDPFLEEIADREMSGKVRSRRTVTIVDGKLRRVASRDEVYLNTSAGWQDISEQSTALRGGAGLATRPDTAKPLLGLSSDSATMHRPDKHLPEIAALLDQEQFDLLTKKGDALLVVTGGAGSGKTTVALHRLAFLSFQDPERYRPQRMQVLVFSAALARYIAWVLPALGVEGVPVRTLRSWAEGNQHRHFPKLVRRFADNTPASVVRFKTHRIMIPMLEEAARAAPGAYPPTLFDELFTDRGWMRKGVNKYAPGAFSTVQIEEIHRWCTDQQFRRYDGAEPDDEPACYDEEDSMILLRMFQLLRGRLHFNQKRRLSYDHLMVDEAQDFSPLELSVLMDTVQGESITFAGDPAQKITENDFSDWSEVLQSIHLDHYQISPLQIAYRSTRQIMEFAHAVLGPLAPDEPLQTVREGAPVELFRFGGQGEALTFLSDALFDLQRREPNASVAVLTRSPAQADEAYRLLRRTDLINLGRISDQEFSFGPGVEVTDVAQTKGLEFDYVVLLNVDRESYTNTPSARHLLHVGATRAIHQLWLLCWNPRSPLLPKDLLSQVAG